MLSFVSDQSLKLNFRRDQSLETEVWSQTELNFVTPVSNHMTVMHLRRHLLLHTALSSEEDRAVSRVNMYRKYHRVWTYGFCTPVFNYSFALPSQPVPVGISTAGTGSDKTSYSHYDVIGNWGHAQRYGRLTAFKYIRIRLSFSCEPQSAVFYFRP